MIELHVKNFFLKSFTRIPRWSSLLSNLDTFKEKDRHCSLQNLRGNKYMGNNFRLTSHTTYFKKCLFKAQASKNIIDYISKHCQKCKFYKQICKHDSYSTSFTSFYALMKIFCLGAK